MLLTLVADASNAASDTAADGDACAADIGASAMRDRVLKRLTRRGINKQLIERLLGGKSRLVAALEFLVEADEMIALAIGR